MNVGFIGTGTMGAPMLGNLVKKGFGVIAYDVVPAALANAEKRGATRAESGADAARRSELVITMLPSSSHVETAYLGKNGVAEGVTAGRLCVDMSTQSRPAVSPSAIPFLPRYAVSTWDDDGSIVITRSLRRAASAPDSARVAPRFSAFATAAGTTS